MPHSPPPTTVHMRTQVVVPVLTHRLLMAQSVLFAHAPPEATAPAAGVDFEIGLATLNVIARHGGEGLDNVGVTLIDVRDELSMQRQIFFVAAGGFDSHDNQTQDQPGLLGGISEAMSAFYDATVEIGAADLVTTFTQSDFGRTLTSNGDGSDHAWGGNQLVMGDAVRGRDMYGTFPILEIDCPDDVTGGRMIPTTSSDQYAATVARWFGIPDQELDIVAPSIDNFAVRDLGFL